MTTPSQTNENDANGGFTALARLFHQKITEALNAANLTPRDLRILTGAFRELTRCMQQSEIVQQGWERLKLARESAEHAAQRQNQQLQQRISNKGNSPSTLEAAEANPNSNDADSKSNIIPIQDPPTTPSPAAPTSTNPIPADCEIPVLASLGVDPDLFERQVADFQENSTIVGETRRSSMKRIHKSYEEQLRNEAIERGKPLSYDVILALKLERGTDPGEARLIAGRNVDTDQRRLQQFQTRQAQLRR